MGFLPAGISSILLTENSPKNANAIDLGIGVALICMMCGLLNCLKKALCLTQNLCCSSIITNHKSLNPIHSWSNACVPIIQSMRQSLSLFFIVTFWLAVSDHVITSRCIHSGSKVLAMVLACCCARIAKGAINAHCFF